MTDRVFTQAPPRKPPHQSQSPAHDHGPLPRPRSFEAEQVRLRRQGRGVYSSAAVHGYLRTVDFPRGTRDRPIRGCDVADATLAALARAVDGRWGIQDGGAVELLERLWKAGHLRWDGVPSKASAGAAMAMLARSCQLVERTGHGRYRIYACKPSDLPAGLLDSLVWQRFRAASTPADSGDSPADAAGFAASDPGPKLSAPDPRNRERACGSSRPGPSSASVGDEQGLVAERPGAAAGSSSPPAEGGRSRPATSTARAELEPLGSWLGSVPDRPQLRRAADLAREFLRGPGLPGTAAIVAGWLAQREDRTSARRRSALARALQSLIRRGFLVEAEGWIRVQDPPRAAARLWRGADPRIGRAQLQVWGPENHMWGNDA